MPRMEEDASDGVEKFAHPRSGWHASGQVSAYPCHPRNPWFLFPDLGLKSQWWRVAASGWSTRLACCLRRPAADTRRGCVSGTYSDLKTHRFGESVRFLMPYAVFPASRRKQHASRVLHPGSGLGCRRDFDASAIQASALRRSVSAIHAFTQSRNHAITQPAARVRAWIFRPSRTGRRASRRR